MKTEYNKKTGYISTPETREEAIELLENFLVSNVQNLTKEIINEQFEICKELIKDMNKD